MPFITKCPGCGAGLQVPDAVVGKRVKCPTCAHAWQVSAPDSADAAASQTPPPQNTSVPMTPCPGCGKNIQIPESMAGKRVKCPACAHVWQVPGGIVDAEEVPQLPALNSNFDDLMSDTIPVSKDSGILGGAAGQPAASDEPPRRPCPMCGEMIVVGAAKCRFCNAVFDKTLRRSEKKRAARSEDQNLSGWEWVFCALCSGIACIFGLVYMIQGKPKGIKIVGVSILFAIFWSVIRAIIETAAHGPQNGFR